MKRHLPRRPEGDEGQLLLLVLGLTLVVALLVTVVVNASRVFLTQRALSAAADGAALAAADALDEAAVYSGAGLEELLPLSDAAAAQAVGAYAADAGLAGRFEGLALASSVSADGTTVTVTAGAVVDLPFLNAVSSAHAGGYPLSVTASARSPLRP